MTTRHPTTQFQFLKYLMVGGLNTIGAGAIIFIAQAAHAGAILANMIGYGIGIAASFALNSFFTFRVKADRVSALRFLVVMGVSYLLNLCTMLTVLHLTGAPYIAQLCGIPVYTIAGFLGNKYWALRVRDTDET